MRAPDGTIFPMSGAYVEIVEPEKLVFTSSALDKTGKPLFENLNEVKFEEHGSGTKLTVLAKVVSTTPEGKPYLGGMNEGWNMTVDRMVRFAYSKR
jgi:uncharacterized protein YndB with AHSA1/START domain